MNNSSKHIVKVREKLGRRLITQLAGYAEVDALWRFKELNEYLVDNDSLEARRHAIVSSVAALEDCFRSFVAQSIDHKPEIVARVSKQIKNAILIEDVVTVFEDEKLTIGELISQFAEFSGVNHIANWVGAITGCELSELVTTAIDPYSMRNRGVASPIVSNKDELFANLAKLFEERHRLAHESYSSFALSHAETKQCLIAARTMAKSLNAILWNIVLNDMPLIGSEMNAFALGKVTNAKRKLAKLIQSIKNGEGNYDRYKSIRKVYLRRRQIDRSWYRLLLEINEGTMFYSIIISEMAASIDQVISELSPLNENFE